MICYQLRNSFYWYGKNLLISCNMDTLEFVINWNSKLKSKFCKHFATKLFLFLLPNSDILQLQFRFTFETSWTLRTKVTFWNAFFFFWFLCFPLESGTCVPPLPLMRPSRNYLRWNSISPVSVVSHPAPNSTLQGSKLHRLSVIVNLSTCMPESLRVWAVCDCTSFAFLTIVRLAFELFFYCCCMGDMRFTIYDIHPTIDPIKQQLST